MITLTEADVEQIALDWLQSTGWTITHGPDIAPDTPDAERSSYDQVVLEQRLHDALADLNSDLPGNPASDDAFRIAHPPGRRLPGSPQPRLPSPARKRRHRRIPIQRRLHPRCAGARSSTSKIRPPTTGSPSTSSPSPKTRTNAAQTLCSSSTACPSPSSNSKTQPTRTPPSGPPGTSSRPTRPSCPHCSA